MTDKITLEAAVSGLSNSMTTQLENVLSLMKNNVLIVDEALNTEIEEFNTLLDEVTRLRDEKQTLELKINSQIESHQHDLDELKNELAENIRQLTAANLKLGTFSELKKELKKYKDMQPERLKDRLESTKKRNSELVADNQKLRSDNKKYRSENSELTILNAQLEKAATEVHNQYSHMAELLNHNDGEVVQKTYKGKGTLECFINVFNYPMSFKAKDMEFSVINDFDFHIEIRTNTAINLTTSCSAWGVCFLPTCSDLEGNMPDDLEDAVRSIYLTRMEKKHSFLLERIEAMQAIGINEVPGLSQKHIDLLEDANHLSVYSVCHVPDFKLKSNVKGLGDKGIQEIRQHVRAFVEKWERENWEPQQVGKFN
ncbi:hypothetical protein D0812_21935 [Vibrio owensii]|uniref:RNA polymerase alpha subunit C-terminal domain-containing protein n=1 Tax=Vibrio owensii TaxID=696485 RepID=A0AAP9GFN6_9VIBR|nr:hypothetical protein [Vibrio owensii]AYO17051.1 hypothetical protein D0812_21935 [Vibrio owensii]QGH49200.1 hypothetical protein APZ19_18960 [Vibrio owensii]